MAALYISRRSPSTNVVSTITAIGAPAASICAATICAAPEKMIALMPRDPSQLAPAAAAPTPHTRPNGTSPTHAGSISTNPSRKSLATRTWRMESTRGRATRPLVYTDYSEPIRPTCAGHAIGRAPGLTLRDERDRFPRRLRARQRGMRVRRARTRRAARAGLFSAAGEGHRAVFARRRRRWSDAHHRAGARQTLERGRHRREQAWSG